MDHSNEGPGSTADRSTVVFVLGKGRSGSTLLDMLLGQIDGVFGTGELTKLWDWGLRQGISCGRGRDVLECEIWSEVLADALGIRSRQRDASTINEIFGAYRTVIRWHQSIRLAVSTRVAIPWPALDVYVDAMDRLYRSLRRTTSSEIIVDSSKIPINPSALGLVPSVDGRALHLVRDPRAVAHSWQRVKEWTDRDEGGHMPRYGWLHTAASWSLRNASAEVVARRWERHTLVRYEDLASSPLREIERVQWALDLPRDTRAFVNPNTVLMGTNHTVGGNPDRRAASGELKIRYDDEWAARTGRSSRGLELATTPFRRRYGY